MLKPFATKDAKPAGRGKRASQKQYSLFGTLRAPRKSAGAAQLESLRLKPLAPLWSGALSRAELQDIQELERASRQTREALTALAHCEYGRMRTLGLSNPADVAAYLAMEALDRKARGELPRFRLELLDFGVSALVER